MCVKALCISSWYLESCRLSSQENLLHIHSTHTCVLCDCQQNFKCIARKPIYHACSHAWTHIGTYIRSTHADTGQLCCCARKKCLLIRMNEGVRGGNVFHKLTFFSSTFLMMILSTSTSVWQSVYIHSVRTLLFLHSEWRYITYLGCSSCRWQNRDSRSRVGKCGIKTTTIWWTALSPKWTVAFSIRTCFIHVEASRLWESQNAFLFYVFWFVHLETKGML